MGTEDYECMEGVWAWRYYSFENRQTGNSTHLTSLFLTVYGFSCVTGFRVSWRKMFHRRLDTSVIIYVSRVDCNRPVLHPNGLLFESQPWLQCHLFFQKVLMRTIPRATSHSWRRSGKERPVMCTIFVCSFARPGSTVYSSWRNIRMGQ